MGGANQDQEPPIMLSPPPPGSRKGCWEISKNEKKLKQTSEDIKEKHGGTRKWIKGSTDAAGKDVAEHSPKRTPVGHLRVTCGSPVGHLRVT